MFDVDSKGVVIVKPEFLSIKEFKDLLKGSTKDKSKKLFAYIYFKHDFKSPYRNSYGPDEIEGKLLKDVLQVDKWKPTNEVIAAEAKYLELQQTKTLKTFLAAENALTQISKYFDDFDIETTAESAKHQVVSNMMKNLKDLNDVIQAIEQARKMVEEELTTKVLAGKRKLRKRELPKSKR